MSVKNGLDMDYATFLGQGKYTGEPYSFTDSEGDAISRIKGQNIPLVGSILVLKPSQDITLQSGQAPSLENCILAF
jgi:hypothetical protein